MVYRSARFARRPAAPAVHDRDSGASHRGRATCDTKGARGELGSTRRHGPRAARGRGRPPRGPAQAVRRGDRRRRRLDLDIRAGEFFSLLGPSGCGKTTTLRMIGGFELPTGGRIELRGRGHHAGAARAAAGEHGLPELRPVPAPHRVRERRLRAAPPQGRRSPRSTQRVGEALELVRLAGFEQPQAGPALGRPAAARRARPRPREPSPGAPAGRAAGRPRSQAPAPAPGGAQARPARGGDHVHLRDPRPGGGARPVRPDRGHGPWPGRAAGHPGGALRRAPHAVRGRLHRHDQPARRARSSPSTAARRRVRLARARAVPRGGRRHGRRRRGRPGDPPRGDPARARDGRRGAAAVDARRTATLAAEVLQSAYLGTSVSHQVRTDDGRVARGRRATQSRAARDRRPVRVSWQRSRRAGARARPRRREQEEEIR